MSGNQRRQYRFGDRERLFFLWSAMAIIVTAVVFVFLFRDRPPQSAAEKTGTITQTPLRPEVWEQTKQAVLKNLTQPAKAKFGEGWQIRELEPDAEFGRRSFYCLGTITGESVTGQSIDPTCEVRLFYLPSTATWSIGYVKFNGEFAQFSEEFQVDAAADRELTRDARLRPNPR